MEGEISLDLSGMKSYCSDLSQKFFYEQGMKGFFNTSRNEIKVTEIVHFLPVTEKMECLGLSRSFFNSIKREIDFQHIDRVLNELNKIDLDELNIKEIYYKICEYYKIHSKNERTYQIYTENMIIFCAGIINKKYLESGRFNKGDRKNSEKYFSKFDEDFKESWEFYKGKLDKFGLKIICNCLSFNNSLKILLIRGCNIDDTDFHLILNFLETNSTLENLDLMYNDISNVGCSEFEKFLLNRKYSNIKKLYLGANKLITKEGIAYIAQGMINNTFIEELSLQAMEMDDSYSGIILSLFGKNNLQSLNFSNNSFSDISMYVWEEALKSNSRLVQLNLCGNNLKDQSAKIFSNILKNHPSLVLVDVKANEFTKDGLKILFEIFEKNEKINFIDVYGNGNNLNDFVEKFRKLNIKRRQVDFKYENNKYR